MIKELKVQGGRMILTKKNLVIFNLAISFRILKLLPAPVPSNTNVQKKMPFPALSDSQSLALPSD